MNLILTLQGAVSQGVLWGIMTMGVYLTFRVLDYSDLTVEGSFALGGAVSAILITNGLNPFVTLLAALLAGMTAGSVTGLLHTKLKIPPILSGILSMIALYSINIRIMGMPNLTLIGMDTIVKQLTGVLPFTKEVVTLLLGVVFAAFIIAALYWFFGTEIGCAIRSTGNNEHMVRALGANTDMMKVLGLLISNGLVALSGALVAQSQGYADVEMGSGAIVIGLASVVIGEALLGKDHSFGYKLFSVVFGSVIYRIIIAAVLRFGFKSTDMKLFTAIIVAAALYVSTIQKKKAASANAR